MSVIVNEIYMKKNFNGFLMSNLSIVCFLLLQSYDQYLESPSAIVIVFNEWKKQNLNTFTSVQDFLGFINCLQCLLRFSIVVWFFSFGYYFSVSSKVIFNFGQFFAMSFRQEEQCKEECNNRCCGKEILNGIGTA